MKKKIRIMCIFCLLALFALPGMVQAETTETINPSLPTPKFTSVIRKGKGSAKVKWSKAAGTNGYQIQFASNEAFNLASSVWVASASTLSKSIGALSTSQNSYLRIRSYKNEGATRSYSPWSANVKIVVWDSNWKYAGNSKIHSDPTVLYYTQAANKKNKTVAINAGHGCKGGTSKKTLCHPDGTAKVTGGSTAAGAKYATSINGGTSVKGMAEAKANLKIALKLKDKLLNAGYNVLMIRQDSDAQLDNIARTVMANHNADCHIAIHFDSTSSNKGAFYISVPNVSSYRNMEPVKSNWSKHNALGSCLVKGLKGAGVKIWGKGSLALDLTQTSYSQIPSVDVEVGDQGTSTSNKNLDKIAKGLLKGIKKYF